MAGTPNTKDPLAEALARVAELESALQVAKQETQTAAQELQTFVYAASHDLQEPLRAIGPYSQLLERMYGSDPQAAEVIGFITDGVARMNGLLHNLLVYSRVKQNPLTCPCRLDTAVQSALFKLSPIIKETGAVIRFEGLPQIPAFEIQMCQLFEQILSNAMLYRGTQPPVVEIQADEGELDGDAALIVKIKDNGVGIEGQYLAQVVQPFKRLHGKDYPGCGLGLAICNKIMRAHNGKLWLESDGKTGTTVHLAFPY